MRNFLLKNIIFLLPLSLIILIIVTFPLYISIASHEIYNISKIVEQHILDHKILTGTVLQSTEKYLKYYTVQKLKPEILVLGTSRVMQFRRDIFKKELTFYNAGGAIVSSRGFIDFINKIQYNPRIIVIGLDQNFFNKKWNIRNNKKHYYEYKYDLRSIFKTALNMLMKGKLEFAELKNEKDYIGLNAVIHGDGFRNDGSYFYNRIINSPNTEYSKKYLFPFDETKERIKCGVSRFEFGKEIDKIAVLEIREFLKICKSRNIEIIGIIPPYAPLIYDELQVSNNYQYIKKIFPNLARIFVGYNFELYDFTNSNKIGDNAMYIDGSHGNELVYRNIIKNLVGCGSKIKYYTLIRE